MRPRPVITRRGEDRIVACTGKHPFPLSSDAVLWAFQRGASCDQCAKVFGLSMEMVEDILRWYLAHHRDRKKVLLSMDVTHG